MTGLLLPMEGLETLRTLPTWTSPLPGREAGEEAQAKSLALATSCDSHCGPY